MTRALWKWFGLGLIFTAGLLQAADDPALAGLLARGDAAAKARRFAEAAALFKQAEQLAPRRAEILVRLSRQYSDLFDLQPKSETLARQSLDYARQAVAADPRNSEAHLRLAVAVGKMTDFVSNKEKMAGSKVVKEEAERAVALDPRNAFAWYVLGRWHQGVAEVNGVLKVIAKVIYGGLPPASHEESLRCFKKADELEPGVLVYYSALARAYTALGKPEEARACWAKVILIAPVDEEERTDVREAKKALGK